jgi:hypothetical protein
MTDASREIRTTRYRRDDGEWMVEVRPGQFINEKAAARMRIDAAASKAPSKSRHPVRSRKSHAKD